MLPNPHPKVYLKKGQMYKFDLNSDEEGNDERVSLPHPDVMEALEIGHRVLIDDGKIMVRTSCTHHHCLVAFAPIRHTLGFMPTLPLCLLLA